MKLNENTNVAMPIKNMVGIIIAVSMGIFAYTEITARLTSLETSRELMNADLLKASEQTTVDKEQFLLLEDLYEMKKC
jgi:L-cysteine desulfidase